MWQNRKEMLSPVPREAISESGVHESKEEEETEPKRHCGG
jgi:hypothetical protein